MSLSPLHHSTEYIIAAPCLKPLASIPFHPLPEGVSHPLVLGFPKLLLSSFFIYICTFFFTAGSGWGGPYRFSISTGNFSGLIGSDVSTGVKRHISPDNVFIYSWKERVITLSLPCIWCTVLSLVWMSIPVVWIFEKYPFLPPTHFNSVIVRKYIYSTVSLSTFACST